MNKGYSYVLIIFWLKNVGVGAIRVYTGWLWLEQQGPSLGTAIKCC